MPTVLTDLVRSHELTEDDNGLMIVRHFVVVDLDPTTSALVQAYGEPGLPAYGDADADFPALVCRNLAFRPFTENSRTQVRVSATFKPPDYSSALSPVIRFSAVAREVLSEFDLDGTPLRVNYTPTGGPAAEPYTVQRRDAKRVGVLEIDRVEANVPTTAIGYIGSVSSDAWQGQPALSWYCRTVGFEKELYRSGYKVSYEFELDPELHVDTLAYRRAFDGRVPTDIEQPVDKSVASGNGWINVKRGRPKPFAALGLPTVFS